MSWAVAILGAGLAVGLALIWQLIRQNGRILVRLEALEKTPPARPAETENKPKSLPAGAILHDFELPLLNGGSMTFSQWLGQPFLVMFVNPACVHCQSLGSRMDFEPAIPTLIVSTGDRDENRRWFKGNVLLQETTEVATLYGITRTPSGYLVDPDGAAACELLVGSEALLAAMKGGVSSSATSPLEWSPYRFTREALKAGAQAPDFTLPQLNGEPLSLSALKGHHVLLVFWDPACPPCVEMARDLEQIHRDSRHVRVLVVTRGKVQDNCDMVLTLAVTFPVVIQTHWDLSRRYGVLATPAGYLVSPDGRLSSDSAIGGPAVLGLASKLGKEQSLEQTI